MIADPYPVIDPRSDLTPIAGITFYDVEARISALNLDDPQPPGYKYRLPLAAEYDPWVAGRDLAVKDKAYWPWGWGLIPFFLVGPIQQGISYYEDGLWHHVGGSVYSWCGDPLDPEGRRVIRGGGGHNSASYVRAAHYIDTLPYIKPYYLGYRLVRGLVRNPP